MSCPPFGLKADCSISNSAMMHRNEYQTFHILVTRKHLLNKKLINVFFFSLIQKFKEKDPRSPVSPQLQKDRDEMHLFLKVRLNFFFVKSRMAKMNIGDSRWPSLREAIHLMTHVSAQLPLAEKKDLRVSKMASVGGSVF